MFYSIFFVFRFTIHTYTVFYETKNLYKSAFRNVSKSKNETFYLHISKICCNFAVAFENVKRKTHQKKFIL